MVPGVQDTVPGSRIISEGGSTAMSINSAATADEADTIRNLKPTEMKTEVEHSDRIRLIRSSYRFR